MWRLELPARARWSRFRMQKDGGKVQNTKRLDQGTYSLGWEWSTGSLEAWSCVSLHLGGQLPLKQDTVEGSLRSVWCSADRLPSPTSEHPCPAPLPTGPHVKARLWPPYRKTALSSSVIRDGQPLSPEAPRVDKGSSLALTSSCLGRLLQT